MQASCNRHYHHSITSLLNFYKCDGRVSSLAKGDPGWEWLWRPMCVGWLKLGAL